jgi:hypothetical protein
MKSKLILLALAAVLAAGNVVVKAQTSGKPYKDGSMWSLTMVRTSFGMDNDYMTSLKNTLKKIHDEAVKQGLIISYKILVGSRANEEDWNVLIMEEFKNMAMMEGQDAKWDAIRDKVLGGVDAEKKLMKERIEIREVVGEKFMREVIF